MICESKQEELMYRTLVLVLSLAALGSFREVEAQGKGSFDGFKLVDKTGNIAKPPDYRDQYEMLGSWTVLDPKGHQMHAVYASPGTAEYYRRNKTSADGTVLVKEIHATEADDWIYIKGYPPSPFQVRGGKSSSTRMLGGQYERGKNAKATVSSSNA